MNFEIMILKNDFETILYSVRFAATLCLISSRYRLSFLFDNIKNLNLDISWECFSDFEH